MEFGVTGLEGVVEPPAEIVVASAGVGLAEEGGDLGGDFWVMEKRVRGRDGGRNGGEDGRECFDG